MAPPPRGTAAYEAYLLRQKLRRRRARRAQQHATRAKAAEPLLKKARAAWRLERQQLAGEVDALRKRANGHLRDAGAFREALARKDKELKGVYDKLTETQNKLENTEGALLGAPGLGDLAGLVGSRGSAGSRGGTSPLDQGCPRSAGTGRRLGRRPVTSLTQKAKKTKANH